MSPDNPYPAPHLFSPAAIAPETLVMNQAIVNALTGMPDWWTIGAAATRAARAAGRGPFPLAPRSPRARMIEIAGPGGPLPLRVIAPERPRGVYLHFHGGGCVLGACDQQDPLLEAIADECGLAVVSVEYRLAPEHPYPACHDDCEAAAAWLIENARSRFGTDRLTVGGESAGAYLSAVTLLRLKARRGRCDFRGANLVFGIFDQSLTPSARQFGEERLILRTSDILRFRAALLPGTSDFTAPDISPLHADLRGLCPALFTVGTRDALLDDSLFMHGRWIAAGNPGALALYPGGAHGFTLFPIPLAEEARARCSAFLTGCVA